MNTEMKIFETEIKDIQELQAKARKYDELKAAVERIKDEVEDLSPRYDEDTWTAAWNDSREIIKKYTEGLI